MKIKRLFYLSWEDALWDLLIHKKVPKNSTVLTPEFFCVDVENNIRKHGYKVANYPVNGDLTVNQKIFLKCVHKYKPAVVVILHANGITNNLIVNPVWLNKLSIDTILIEDCVHRIIDPSKIRLLRKNHFMIDSLRKVLPLQGSNIWGSGDDLNYPLPPIWQSYKYGLTVTLLWAEMSFYWLLSLLNHRFGFKAEKTMEKGYDLIGDSLLPARGWIIFRFLFDHIDQAWIRQIKRSQIMIYEKLLGKNFKTPYLATDRNEIRGWPLIFDDFHLANIILLNLRSAGNVVYFSLEGCKWTNKHKLLCLPLGPQVRSRDIIDICQIIKTALPA
jgi:hypothetical protein